MKVAEIRQKNPTELDQLIKDTRASLAEAALDLRTKQVKNVKATLGLRKTLAQALTLKNEPQKVEKK